MTAKIYDFTTVKAGLKPDPARPLDERIAEVAARFIQAPMTLLTQQQLVAAIQDELPQDYAYRPVVDFDFDINYCNVRFELMDHAGRIASDYDNKIVWRKSDGKRVGIFIAVVRLQDRRMVLRLVEPGTGIPLPDAGPDDVTFTQPIEPVPDAI